MNTSVEQGGWRAARAARRRAERASSMRRFVVKLLALAAWWLAVWTLAARPAHAQVTHAQVTHAQVTHAQAARDSVAVAARTLPRGHVVTADDVAWISADSLARLGHAVVPGASSAIAGTTRRVVAAGEPLRAPAVTAADAVAAGDRVAVVWRDAGIELRMQGTALNAAPLGGRAAVRVDARRRLTGTVAAPGIVKLD